MELKAFNDVTLVHDMKHDLCSARQKPDIIKSTLAIWAIPVKQSFTFCHNGTKKIKLSAVSQKMLPLISLMRDLTFRISITHDTQQSLKAV